MNLITHSGVSKWVLAAVGLAVALSFVFAAAVPNVHAQTVEELQAQIADLLALITSLQTQLTGLQGGGPAPAGACTFTRDLTLNVSGDDVVCLQNYLTGTGHFTFSGGSTGFFGPITRTAVAAWQSANNVAPAVGYFGTISRTKYNSLVGSLPPGPGPGPAPTGTGLTVSRGSQPSDSLAPFNGSRVPFTNFTVTAGLDGDVVMNSVQVERTGLAKDSNFTGIVLLDQNGLILGRAKTLNSNHQTTVGEAVTIPRGQSRTFTVAGNMATAANINAGEVASLSIVGVNTSAAVSGSLPIVGAFHTMNASLAVGTVTTARGALDPGANQTKEVGEKDYVFSSVKFTAGSAEDLWLRSVTWEQTGSASSGDLANVVTIVDGVSYPTVVGADGQRYTTVFPGNGLNVEKGFSKDLSIRGDIVGGSDRTVDFDIQKRTDVYFVGQDFGYGVTPPFAGSAATADSSTFNNQDDPYYDASQVTVSTGNVTVSSWTGVSAQNVAVNLQDQPLGGFSVDVRGEAIDVGGIVFNVLATGDEAENITNVTLVDGNGSVLAGPVDGTSDAANSPGGKFTFTDSVTFPIGVTNLTLRGKLGTNFVSNDTVAASTTASTDWTTVTGEVTGKSITPSPASAVTGSTMTVKAGALTVSVSSQPTARNVVAGANQFEFARYTFEATNSGEDVRVTTIPLYFDTNGTRTDLTSCQLYDGIGSGASSVTTGSNIKNPATGDTASSTTFTFNGAGLVVPKGTSKTLSVRCNVKSGVTSKYWWGLDTAQAAAFSGASGVTSGQTITEALNEANGQVMTAVAGGSYSITNDTSVLYKVAQAGSSGVTLGAYRFEANTSEDVRIRQLALVLGNTASNSPADLVGEKVTLWDGSTQVGEAQFGGTNSDNATSTLTTSVLVPKGESRTITVKGDLSSHNADTGTPGAFFTVDYDENNNGLNGNYATGADSGSTITGPSTAVGSTNGLRIFRTVPTVEDVTPSGRQLAAGSDLYELKITAGSGRDVGLEALAFEIATTGATVTNFQLFGPSGSVASAGDAGDGTYLRVTFDDTNVDRRIGAGTSKTFRLRANTVTGLTGANVETLNINLRGDAAYPSLAGLVGTVAAIGTAEATDNNFVWTPFSTTTQEETADIQNRVDWTNGYGVSGFPGVGQNMPVQSFNH